MGFAQGGDDAITASVGGAKVDEQDLIVSAVDDVLKLGLTLQQVDFGQLALKDAELDVISPVFHGFEDLAQPFGISDVVADDVGVLHGGSSKEGTGKRDQRMSSLIRQGSKCS